MKVPKTNSEKKEAYRQLCQSTYIPIASQDWWLDAVCNPKNWNVCLSYNKNGKINGALPYYKKSNFGFKLIKLPPFSANLNIWFAPNESPKLHHQQAENQYITEKLIEQIPSFTLFDLNFSSSFTNWLPFHWAGFQQTTRYTYQLLDLKNLVHHFEKNLYRNVRKNIKKAQKFIKIIESENLQRLYQLSTKSYQRQGKKNPLNFEVLLQLDTELKKRNQRKILFAVDSNDNFLAGGYLVWDQQCAYYLFSGRDEDLGDHGAHNLLLWKALEKMTNKVSVFDFEGSMHSKIEPFLRAFGGQQIPYHRITKIPNPILNIVAKIRLYKQA